MKVLDAIKSLLRKVKNKGNKGINWLRLQYEGSSRGIELMANIVVPVLAAIQCMGTGLPVILDFCLFTLLFLLLFYSGKKLIVWLTKPICKPYFRSVFNGIALFLTLYIYLETTVSGRTEPLNRIVIAVFVVLLEHLFVRSLYVLLVKRKIKPFPCSVLGITLVLNLGLGLFLFGNGFATDTVSSYLKLEKAIHTDSQDTIYSEAVKNGEYTVCTLDYGTDPKDSLSSTTIDLSSYLWDNTGIKKIARQMYLGYDTDKVPLRGRIWYPKEASNCPVVFIVHGNHTMTTESYLGYGYIGEHLASIGYVVVSVDENVCNFYLPEGIAGENSARAYLLLENMRQVQTYQKVGPLAGKMDYSNLAIMGHSRGGEAVALATLYNEIGHNPDVGYQTYEYNFQIKSVVAIAPSVDQYQPAGRDVTLQDVNYLLIQGANDQDVSQFMGMKQYNNISFSGSKDCYKTYLYIAGANHGQFNTYWQQDVTFPRNLMLNQAEVMEGSEQREILLGWVTAFFEDTLLGKRQNRSLFQESTHFDTGMPDTVYVSGYEDNTFSALADYEEDISLNTITVDKGTSFQSGLCFYREQAITYNTKLSSYDTDNHAVYLWWNTSGAKYGLDLTKSTLDATTNNYLQFDVADVDTGKLFKDITQLLDFDVKLTDNEGNIAFISVAKYCNLYPPLPVSLFKTQRDISSMDIKTELQTVRINLSSFEAVNGSLKRSEIVKVEFVFNKQEEGRILLDNIGFAR